MSLEGPKSLGAPGSQEDPQSQVVLRNPGDPFLLDYLRGRPPSTTRPVKLAELSSPGSHHGKR